MKKKKLILSAVCAVFMISQAVSLWAFTNKEQLAAYAAGSMAGMLGAYSLSGLLTGEKPAHSLLSGLFLGVLLNAPGALLHSISPRFALNSYYAATLIAFPIIVGISMGLQPAEHERANGKEAYSPSEKAQMCSYYGALGAIPTLCGLAAMKYLS